MDAWDCLKSGAIQNYPHDCSRITIILQFSVQENQTIMKVGGRGGGPVRARWQESLPTSCKAKSKLYCGPDGPTASIFYGI